ncbi:peroxisomal assembly protein [Balamuthia mandrillaris]
MERLRLAEEERSLVPAEETTFWEDLPSVVLRVHVAPAAVYDDDDGDADQQRATSTSKQRDALRRRKKNHSPPHRYFPLCVFLPVEAMNSLDVPDEEDFPIAVSLCRLSGVRCPPAEGEEDVSQTNRKRSAAITATAWIETGRQQALALAFPNYSKSAGVGKHVPSYSSSHFSLDELGGELLRNEEDGEVEDETDEVMEEEKNQLAVSACFAGQHGLRKGDIVRVRHLPKNVLALSRVVLMAKTKRAYRIASLQEDVFKHSLMINHQIVCRGGDVKLSRTQLPPPPCNDDDQTDTKHKEAQKQQEDDTKEEETTEGFEDYAVLECHPLLQGLITSRSTIVVLPPMEPSSFSLHVDKVEDSNSAEKEYDKKSVGVIMTNDKSHQKQDEKEKEDEGPEARTPLLMSSFILPQARRLFLSSEDDDQESKQDDSDAEDNGIKQQKPQHHEHSTVSSMNGVSSGPSDEKRTEKRTKEEELNVGLLRGMISRPQPRTSWRDPLCEVGATFRTLRRLHVFSGSWIVLSCSTSGKSRLARVYVLSDNADSSPTLSLMFDRKEQEDVKQKNRALLSMKKDGVLPKDGTLYMSPFLFFNLGFDVQEIDVATVSVRPAVAISSSSSSIGERTTTPAPFFSATHVSIARVNSPASSGHVSYSRALVQHFKHPRLLCLGDVFPVIVKRSSPWHEYEYGPHDVEQVETDAEDDKDDEYDDDEEEEKDYEEAPEEGKVGEENEQEWHELVHFKVVSIEPTIIPHERTERFYCVTRKDSTLLQEGSVNSPVPPMMEHYLFRSPSILGDWEGGDDMGGLKEAWQELTSLVEPCLHPLSQRLGLTCSLLIHGPRANAKSRLVSAVAKRFGVHLLSVNCFDLLAPSEVQTEVNLRELFKEAELCSPSILFLRSLSAFDKASQQQQQSKDPSIAKLLRELIPSSETTLEQNLHRTTLNDDDDDYNDEDYSKRILVIATTDSIEELSASLRACFRHEMEVPSPSQKQRCQALVRMLEGVPLAMDVSPADIAMKTAAFVYDDLRTMVAHASSFAVQRVVGGIRGRLEEEKRQGAPAFNVNIPDRELEIVLCSAGVMLTVEDFDQAIGHLQAHHSVTMGAPKVSFLILSLFYFFLDCLFFQ